jgi:CheY-like chemotaxis protein
MPTGGSGVSLVGSLQDLPFSDILQIVCLSRRSGILTLESRAETVVLHFRTGLLTGVDVPGEESPLIRGFRASGLVEPEVLDQAIRECRRAGDSLLQILAAKAYLEPNRVRDLVVSEVRGTLRRLLAWEKGEFRFDLGRDPSAPGAPQPAQGIPDTDPGAATALRFPEGLDIREMLLEEMTARGAEAVHHFFLPNLPATLPGAASAFPRPEGAATGAQAAAPCVVLVDDRTVYRESLASLWRKEGFGVETFTSPEAGYQRFAHLMEASAPVTLVTELLLPETGGSGFAGGLELLIRARQEFPESRVILMSEGIDATVQEAATSLGARGILEKPAALPADAEGLQTVLESLGRSASRLFGDGPLRLETGPPEETPDTQTIRVVDQLSLLGALLGELRRPESDLEIPLLVLRLASEYFERGLLLAVDAQQARGLGGFSGGKDGPDSPVQKCRDLALPLEPGGRLREVVEAKSSVRGRLALPGEQQLLDHLGGGSPPEGVLLPLLSRDQVVAVLYGDNGHSASPVGDTRGLEIFLGEVGLALERSLRPPARTAGRGSAA